MKIFNIFVLFISIFTLNNSIVSMTPECSSEYRGSEYLTRPLNMTQLVDLVSDALSNGSLTFNSPVPPEMYDVFMNGMTKVRNTIPHHESELAIITEKARTLLESGQLTSKWLMHLSLCTAALLSPADNRQNFYLTLGGSIIEEGFERFTYLHDNADSLRDNFYKFRTSGVSPDEEINFEGFSLTFSSSTDIKWIIEDNCFWIPWIGQKPYFKANTFNKAYANRVAILGIPLKDCGYDGTLLAPPIYFAIHEMDHADDYFSYRRNPERIFFDRLNDPRDILVTFTRTLWEAVEKGQEKDRTKDSINDYLLFLILHENLSGGLPEDIYTVTTSLDEFIETVLENAPKISESKLFSGQTLDAEKLELEGHVQFLNGIDEEVTVENFLSRLDDFKALFNSASSAAHP